MTTEGANGPRDPAHRKKFIEQVSKMIPALHERAASQVSIRNGGRSAFAISSSRQNQYKACAVRPLTSPTEFAGKGRHFLFCSR